MGNPCHGITIDHPSTQRIRKTSLSGMNIEAKSSTVNVCGFSTNPPTDSVHGEVLNDCASFATPSLSVENS